MEKTINNPTKMDKFMSEVLKGSNTSDLDHSSAKSIVQLLVIVILAALAYIALSAYWIKFSRAEVFFAECAREMLVTNNFITPLYHAQPFFDKPIFVYWLIIAMFKTAGINHFAARIPSICASLISIVSGAIGTAYVFGKRAGILSALILSTSFMYLSFSCLCMSDMFLFMFDTLTLMAIYAGIVFDKNRSLYWWLASLSMGCAFLTKGPVGVVLPALATLVYLGIQKNLSIIKTKHIVVGLISLAVVSSPWFIAAYLANGSQSMAHFFIQENLQRFAGSTYDVHKPFWYTVGSFFLGFAPWSILVPPALFVTGKNLFEQKSNKINGKAFSGESSAELFLWTWLFVSVGFFCFSRGKCDYYTMPAFIAAAPLVSYYAIKHLSKYVLIIKVLAISILVSTILFSVLILPQINKLIPIEKYVSIINNMPKNLQVGVDEKAASWIDEILFQSGKDPQRLADQQQIEKFISAAGNKLLIMPEDRYKTLSNVQKKNFAIISRDVVSTHPLTPGYFFEKKGNIADAQSMLVVSNYRD